MIEKTIKLYTIDELSEESKDRVVKDNANINRDWDWWVCCLYPNLIEEAKSFGFEIKKDRNDVNPYNIYFSLYGQGSGLCFEYTMDFNAILERYVDKTGWSEAKLKFVKKYAEFSLNGVQKGFYYHENSVNHDIKGYYYANSQLLEDRIVEFWDTATLAVEEKYKELCRKYYRILEEEDQYLCSKEAIIETIRANEFLFLENGKEL